MEGESKPFQVYYSFYYTKVSNLALTSESGNMSNSRPGVGLHSLRKLFGNRSFFVRDPVTVAGSAATIIETSEMVVGRRSPCGSYRSL